MEPTSSAPVQAPPTELFPGYLETDDEDLQETSGQGMDTTTVQGKETDIRDRFRIRVASSLLLYSLDQPLGGGKREANSKTFVFSQTLIFYFLLV